MKKLITIFLSTLLLLAMFVLIGCEKSGDSDYGVIEIAIISPDGVGATPAATDTLSIGDSLTVVSKLTGFTDNYSKVNYYFGTSTTPAAVYTKQMLNLLAEEQQKDAEFAYAVSTNGLSEGEVILRVEALGNDLTSYSAEVTLAAKLPGADDSSLDIVIISPSDDTEFKIGDRITVEIGVEGNLTLYENLKAYLNNSSQAIYASDIVNATKTFDIVTEGFAAGNYTVKMDLELKTGEHVIKSFNFSLVEYIPTFTVLGAVGYEIKSIIQTYDNGYLTVSSYPTAGSRIVKYDKEGTVEWTKDIPASEGIAESICEDTEYDKGYVVAGWRNNGTDKDTWVRKVNQTDGGLIWNKTYGYTGVDDGATVIKKSVDDGYIIGGYSLNPYGVDSLIFNYEIGEGVFGIVKTTWETGYDVRLLKLYSNGNEVWGNDVGYVSHKMWHDITLHKKDDYLWVTKMGDQMITDLIVKSDGNFLVTGSNNFKLYYQDGTDNNDMFFAEFDNFGGYVSTMTWTRISAFDLQNMAGEDDPYAGILNTSIKFANHLGGYDEEEIGYGLVQSQGGFGGDVVMAGETIQNDTKAKLNDGWVVEFGVNADEDGALWEYSFGGVAKNDKAYGISATKDGGYIVTGYKTVTDMNTWLFKLDSQLALLWEKDLGVVGNDTGVKVLQCTDGGFIVGANVGAGAAARAKLIKVNKTGDSVK